MVNFENGKTPINDANLNKMQRDLIGIILYEDETGTTGNISLTDDINNYSSYKIYGYYLYQESVKAKFCKEFKVDSIATIDLLGNVYNGGYYTYLIAENASINENAITRGSQYKIGLCVPPDATTTNDLTRESGAYVYITKVVAYKEA